eukprot:PITA_05457
MGLANRQCMGAFGSSHALASLINSYCSEENENENFEACEEALGILHLIPITHETAKSVTEKATMVAFVVLIEICKKSRKNRLLATKAGAVFSSIELLSNAEKPKCERILDLLDMLMDYAEGRAAMADHAMGIVVVLKKIIRVSLCTYSSNAFILRDMLQCRALSKLCTLQQLDCTNKTNQKAKEVLKLHANTFKASACLLHLMKSDYPNYI